LTSPRAPGRGKVLTMLWKLRLLWYRIDKASFAFAMFFAAIVGSLVFALTAVHAERDERNARVREFHARHLECLARNVYYEARGESTAGQYAVAEVTMNRKASPHYPKTVCEVVYQREAFSWTGMGRIDEPAGDAWERAVKIAEDVYYERRPRALHPGVTHFHATYVQPDWSKERQRVARIGRHIFYR
jgi:spore germination cell wall hydrolase CwlJ-like protein